MKKVLVLGGTGFIGRHTARRLADKGWDVTVASRGEAAIPFNVREIRHVTVDRSTPDGLSSVTDEGFDVLVDVIPYEIDDAQQLLELGDRVGSVVAISTASVYADEAGHTLDEATGTEDFPRMPVPIRETQVRTKPGDETYSTKKVAIEDLLLNGAEFPVTVIRPCAIYGPGAKHCREWFFVKRVLDRRPRVVLAHEGRSVFHSTSVHNLAEMVRLASEQPGTRALNCGDPDPPSVRKIASLISDLLKHDWEEVLVPSAMSAHPFLENPWGVPEPWVLDMSLPHRELGFVPVATYDNDVVKTVGSIVDTVTESGAEAFSTAIPYLPRAFDYEAEDAFVGSLADGRRPSRAD
jgi:nucleoside-diphosphate-sugar epimerase